MWRHDIDRAFTCSFSLSSPIFFLLIWYSIWLCFSLGVYIHTSWFNSVFVFCLHHSIRSLSFGHPHFCVVTHIYTYTYLFCDVVCFFIQPINKIGQVHFLPLACYIIYISSVIAFKRNHLPSLLLIHGVYLCSCIIYVNWSSKVLKEQFCVCPGESKSNNSLIYSTVVRCTHKTSSKKTKKHTHK